MFFTSKGGTYLLERELYNAVVLQNSKYFSNKFNEALQSNSIVQVEHVEVNSDTYRTVYRKDNTYLTSYYFANHEVLFLQAGDLYSFIVIALERMIDGITGMEVYLESNDYEKNISLMEQRIINEKGKCDSFPYMQLYGQELWHSPAFLLANEEGLLKLREAIDVALENGEYRHVTSSSAGDGYDLLIKKMDVDMDWSKVKTPYTALMNKEEETTIKPQELFMQYRTILEEE